ncbi:MAG TPA: hypothetical protein VMT62_09705 [Syntrophorhabdaceae bacterium]|nr:hypothetical protein [Syntrophorhabdaceae bacterium]
MADTPEEKEPDTQTPNNDASNKHHGAHPIFRPKLQIPSSVINAYRADQEKKNRIEKWKLRIEVFTLLAIVAYAIIAYLQWQTMQEATGIANKAANTAQGALAAQIESARQDRRPWVGLKDVRCEGCTGDTETITIGQMFGVIENSGKTPAIRMVINSAWTNRKAIQPIPDYDSVQRSTPPPPKQNNLPPALLKEMEALKRLNEPAKTALPPNANRVLPIMASFSGKRGFASMTQRQIYYAVGKITYYGAEGNKQYTTNFCLMNEFGVSFRFCPTGNDMK